MGILQRNRLSEQAPGEWPAGLAHLYAPASYPAARRRPVRRPAAYRRFPAAAGVADPLWWRVPLVFTPLVLVAAYVDLTTTGMWTDHSWALGYLIPLAVVATTWRPDGDSNRREMRIRRGVLACMTAFFFTKVLMGLIWGFYIAMLLAGMASS
ncbi:hypothetical protein AB0M39_12220 [Streptomyces sp. NPDC051907]|uniref:hypothetical protein n=1 Tax=Streptomyces sp. NPDC051907 TaxID=3155284 RepID=UPI00344932FA